MIEIGVNIEDISRFEGYSLEYDFDFLNSIFSPNELDYCFSQSKPAKHLTRFCAKEAFFKAVSGFNMDFKFNEIKVLNKKTENLT